MANSFHSSRLYGFFCELRRRKVYRVAAGYGVVGWLVIQFAVTVLPRQEIAGESPTPFEESCLTIRASL